MKFKIEYFRKNFEVICRVDGIGVKKEDRNKPVEVFGDLRPRHIPLNIFNDFVNAFETGRPVGETLLWKAIRPDVPAKYSYKWGYWMIIHGEGLAPDYLAGIHKPGPYWNRFPTDVEYRFLQVFRWAVKVKWSNAYYPGSKNEEIEEMRGIVMQPSSVLA